MFCTLCQMRRNPNAVKDNYECGTIILSENYFFFRVAAGNKKRGVRLWDIEKYFKQVLRMILVFLVYFCVGFINVT